MAWLEYIHYTPMMISVCDGAVAVCPATGTTPVQGLPQLFWRSRRPWLEPNLWARDRAVHSGTDIRTVQSNMLALRMYMEWLETTGLDWQYFPVREADRCLYRFCGYLKAEHKAGRIALSTASVRMASVIRFYRWALRYNFIQPMAPMWEDRKYSIPFTDRQGVERSLCVTSTNLHIRNRRPEGDRIEGGLAPVSAERRDAILRFAHEHASHELYLMLRIGFFTGMRIGTISDLRIASLQRAAPDEATADLYWIAVGPGAHPPVHTKGSVTGQIPIPRLLLEELLAYAAAPRRLLREGRALASNRGLLFLTVRGNPYVRRGTGTSSAINTEMHGLRAKAATAGLSILHNFHFHQTRATFATQLARLALEKANNARIAIALVQRALMHKNEETSFRYIKFVQTETLKAEVAESYMKLVTASMLPAEAQNK